MKKSVSFNLFALAADEFGLDCKQRLKAVLDYDIARLRL
jgi:hypothetical protein